MTIRNRFYRVPRHALLMVLLGAGTLGAQSRPEIPPARPVASTAAPALAAARAPATAPDANSAVPPLYVIQPNDLLSIFVWKEPTLSTKVLVRPDGRISFPLVQDMQASGMNPTELKLKIEERLKEYIEIPNVTVVVDAIQSYRVFVTGRVAKPGALMAEKPLTVLQALALAGGFTEFANPAETVIIRNSETENKIIRFNYRDVIKGINFDQNFLLKSGDVVVVP